MTPTTVMRRLKPQRRWQQWATVAMVVASTAIKTIADSFDPLAFPWPTMIAFNLVGFGTIGLIVLGFHRLVVAVWNTVVAKRTKN